MKIVNFISIQYTITHVGSLVGYVVHAIPRIPTLGVINEKGYSEFTVEDDWGRCLHVHDFIWDCFHGLLKGEKIKHINKRRDDNRFQNMKLRSSNDIVIRGSASDTAFHILLILRYFINIVT